MGTVRAVGAAIWSVAGAFDGILAWSDSLAVFKYVANRLLVGLVCEL